MAAAAGAKSGWGGCEEGLEVTDTGWKVCEARGLVIFPFVFFVPLWSLAKYRSSINNC